MNTGAGYHTKRCITEVSGADEHAGMKRKRLASHIALRGKQSSRVRSEAGAPFPPSLYHEAEGGKEASFYNLGAVAGFLVATVVTPAPSR